MKNAQQKTSSKEANPVTWILIGLFAVTLYFQVNLNDPFNSPKFWIVMLVSAWLAGFIISSRSLIFSDKPLLIFSALLLAFNLFGLIATLMTDFKYVGFFGDTQRRNGFLSYLGLSIIALASALFFRVSSARRLINTTILIAALTAIYAFMQTNGKDFVKWNNPYNSIIGTVGNPNFAAAVMAVMGTLIVASFFMKDLPSPLKYSSPVLAVALLFLIVKSQARQGLLAFLLGVGVFVCILVSAKNRKLGWAFYSAGTVVFILGVAGMLQQGPLKSLLYKPSVSVRGYYWRAGYEMFLHHPIFGVGMDRYGAYFKEYREVGYPLSYGFSITSSNAHNTFIQLFATGGLFLGLTYLLLNIYIFTRAIAGLRKLSGDNRIFLAGVFSAWIGFHAQSLISIDNLGISIWGWILGGVIVALSLNEVDNKITAGKLAARKQAGEINLGRVIASIICIIPVAVLVGFLYRAENNNYKASFTLNLGSEANRTLYHNLQLKAINSTLNDPSYSVNRGMSLVQGGFVDEGLSIVKKLYKDDPRNQDALNGLALASESLNKFADAIMYREQMAKLDPWNAVNYLALGKDYKAQGNIEKSKEMLDKILSFAAADPIAQQAKTELVS